MKIIRDTSFQEKTLAFIFILVFLVFAVFFTHSNLEEAKSEFNQKKLDYTKSLAKEITVLLDNQVNVSSKLSNVISENSVAYVVIHKGNGEILLKTEGFGLPVGIFETAETEALKAQHIIITPFKDPAGMIALSEVAMPIYSTENEKYILRVGYFRNSEEDHLSHIKFRNILVFSLIFIFFGSIWTIGSFPRLNIRYALVGSSTFVMLILFFAGAYTIRHWYGPFWRNCFVENECVGLSKMLLPSAIKLIDEKSSEAFEKATKLLGDNKSFIMSSLIKDDVFIFHTDFERIGKLVEDDTYRKSLNSNNPSVFKNSSNGIFYVLIPIMRGNTRIGTIYSAWRNDGGMKNFAPLRDRLTMVFIFSYLVLYWFMHLYSKEIINRFAALSRRNGFVSNQEIKLQTINPALKEFKNGKKLATTVFIYYSGIDEAVNKFESDVVIESAARCNQIVIDACSRFTNLYIQQFTDGISVTFFGNDEQDSIFNGIELAEVLNHQYDETNDFCFNPKITVNTAKLLPMASEKDNQQYFIGQSLMDYKTISKVQSRNEIILGSDLYGLIKGLVKCDNLEILSPECGKFSVYCFNCFCDSNEIEKKYNDSLDWTKLMILRILKNDKEYHCGEYENWIKDANPIIKERLLNYFHKYSDRS